MADVRRLGPARAGAAGGYPGERGGVPRDVAAGGAGMGGGGSELLGVGACPTVTRLTLTDFRSYAAAELAVGPGAIVVTGDNGQGKTNLLDAVVAALSPGRGLRAASRCPTRLGAMGRVAGRWASEVAAAGGTVAIGTGTLADAPDRRVVRINGAAAPRRAPRANGCRYYG